MALDEFKPATAFVYVDVAGAPPSDPRLTYDLELSATTSPAVDSGARSLGPPVVVRVSDPPPSDTPWVELWERDNVVGHAADTNRNAIPIALPYAWRTAGESIRLQATLKFPDAARRGTAGYGTVQCASPGCEPNDTFSLRNVPFVDYPAIKIASIALRQFNQLNAVRGGQSLPEARTVLDRALALYPGGAGYAVSPFQTTININGALRLNAMANTSTPADDDFLCNGKNYTQTTASEATRSCRWEWIETKMRAWAGGNPARGPGRVYDVLFGVHNYNNGIGTEPGTARSNITQVRWRASDPDGGGALEASVDFSADGGRTWRTVHSGADAGAASIPLAMLTGSRRARVRVNVNDGFAQTTVRSAAIRVPGTKPRVRIVAPSPRETVRTGERVTLAGSAVDDAGRTLTGSSLTWFSGSRRLGSGARLRTLLGRATRSVRLVARDRNGLTATAAFALRVTAPPLRLESVQVPRRVGRGARSMRVRIRTSAPATLVAGGRRYRLGRAASTVVVKLPRRPAVGILSVAFRIAPRGAGASGTVTGRFSTART